MNQRNQMGNHMIRGAVIILVLVCIPFSAFGDNFKATLAEMPVHAVSEKEGVQVNLVRAIEQVSGHYISIGVYPFARSMKNVIEGKADFHIPLIKNDVIPEKDLPYYYSTMTIFQVNFVLYTRKDSGVTRDNLSEYRIETDRAHVDYFPFEILPSSRIDSSLKKLSLGRIDGYIFADTATDPVLIDLGLKNIRRSLYKTFEVKIILPKNEHGKEVDRMLFDAI